MSADGDHDPIPLDGAAGSMPQSAESAPEEHPVKRIIDNPLSLIELQKRYLEAGSAIIRAPTSGMNRAALAPYGLAGEVAALCEKAVSLTRRAADGRALVAASVSPCRLRLPPAGEASFEQLVAVYREQALACCGAGADLFSVEGMTHIADARAALLAIREVCALPVFVSMSCGEDGRTASGTDALSALITLQGLGADAFGLDGPAGPDDMLETMKRIAPYAAVPLLARPNAQPPCLAAGGPDLDGFARYGAAFAAAGTKYIGGGRGTAPEHIRRLVCILSSAAVCPPPAPDIDGSMIVVSTERDTFFLDPAGVEISEPIPCSDDMSKKIMEAEEQADTVLLVSLNTEEDLSFLSNNLYMIELPLCVRTDSSALLGGAARIYGGRLLFDGSSNADERALSRLRSQYGIIAL